MRQLLIITILITSALFFFTCKKESNPLYLTESAQLSLQVDGEPYCTEVYLQLKAEGIKFPGKVQLVRDSVMIFSYQFDKTGTLLDTLLLDSALLPGTSYHYEARLLLPEGDEVQSRELSVRTMDTTSHNFTWEIFEFGGGGGYSELNDIVIINENNIWAVGKISTPETDRWNEDSTEWISPYNAVHWDGEQWELLHIATNQCGGVKYPPIRTAFVFSENDILFGHADGSITRYDGNNFRNDCSLIYQFNGSVRKIWGISSSDFYVASGNGFIAHYNGSRWEKIESGTEVDMTDIWGNGEHIFVTATETFSLVENQILEIRNKATQELEWPFGNYYNPYSIWFHTPRRLWICGSGIFLRNYNNWNSFDDILSVYLERIRGTNENNIYAVGHFGYIFHFNGMNWKWFKPINRNIIYQSVSTIENLAVACGTDGAIAYICIIRSE